MCKWLMLLQGIVLLPSVLTLTGEADVPLLTTSFRVSGLAVDSSYALVRFTCPSHSLPPPACMLLLQ